MKSEREKIIDLDYLVTMSKGNDSFVKEMIHLFLTENPAEIASLENSITTKNYTQVKTVAHKLKSTLAFVGLDKAIGNDILRIEMLASENRGLEEIHDRFMIVKEACNKAYKELLPAAGNA